MLFRALLYIGISPFKVKREIEIRLVFSLRDQIGNEGLKLSTAFEINLELSLSLTKKNLPSREDKSIKNDGVSTIRTFQGLKKVTSSMNLPLAGAIGPPAPSRIMTSRDKPFSFSSRMVVDFIMGMNFSAWRHLIRRISQTCSMLRTGSMPGGLMGEVCDLMMTTIAANFSALSAKIHGNCALLG